LTPLKIALPMRNLGLIIAREFSSRVRRPAFLWITLAGPVLIALFAIAAIRIGSSTETQRVLVIDEGSILNASLSNSNLAVFDYREEDVSNEFFKDSPYDLILFINPKFATNNKVIIQYKQRPSPYVVSEIVRQLEYRLERLKLHLHNVDPEAYAHIKQPVDFRVVNIDGVYAEYDRYGSYAGLVFGMIIFFFIGLYGTRVMRGVVEEKTGRVVEVVVSSVRPVQLMAGKILGIGLAAMLQFMLWCILTFAALQAVKQVYYPDRYNPEKLAAVSGDGHDMAASNMHSGVNEVAEIIYSAINYPLMLGFFLFFFVFGYLLYAAILGSLGALVDNETDSNQLLIPALLPLMLGFVAAWAAIQDPSSPAATWGGLIPFTSPIVMMTRIAIGFGPGELWQLYLSMGILVVSVVLCTWLSARIYRAGILRYGRRFRLRDFF
jgi:ABC-2 type transport system permease protein